MGGDDQQEVAAALAALAPRLAAGATGIAGLRRLTGGASLATWAFDAAGPDGGTPLILRRRGPGGDGGAALPLATEARLLAAAAAGGVPVPAVVHVCAAGDGLGEAYVMARVGGEALGRRIVRDAAFAPARAAFAGQCGAALARIHALPPDPALATMDAAATLAHYEAIWRDGGLVRPAVEAAFRWLERRLPPPVAEVTLHGDFRVGNLMIDPDTGLVAVLDWELAHRGDPAEDLGWLCVNSWRFGGRPEVGGIAPLGDLLAAYAAAGGTAPDPGRVRFWQALGSLKWAVMTTMMYASFASGADRSVERAVIGRRLSECEVDLLALMRAGL